MKMMKSILAAAFVVLASGAQAATLNGDGNLQNGVVFGSGNDNGSFTGVNDFGVELGLRGKLRYDLNGSPQNVFNYDGDRTYTFDPALSNAPGNRSIWNFEFSIDVSDTGETLASSGWEFVLGVDTDPSASIANAFGGFSPFLLTDNAGGDAVAQNSQNLGFGYTAGDPQALGTYTISLFGTNGTDSLSTSIDVVVAPAAIPLPAGMALMLTGLGALGLFGRRRKTA